MVSAIGPGLAMQIFFFIFIMCFVAGVILCFSVDAFEVKSINRRNRVDTIAIGLGLEFQDVAGLHDEVHGSELLVFGGHSHQFTNCVKGEADGVRFLVFEFSWKTGKGKRESFYAQTVCLIRNEALELPEAVIRPKSSLGFGRTGRSGLVNGTQIDPMFDNFFFTSSIEPHRVRQMLSQQARELLLENQVTVESLGDRLLVYRPNMILPSDMVEPFLKDSLQLFAFMEAWLLAPVENPLTV